MSQHAVYAFSYHGLFKSDRIDKNMTVVGKSRIVVEGRCLLLAESTAQIIKETSTAQSNIPHVHGDTACVTQKLMHIGL